MSKETLKTRADSAEVRTKRKVLSPSLEDYLEAIHWIVQEHQVARVSQIAKRLAVSKSSVTGALKALSAKGYIDYDPYQYITLTETGRRTGQDIVRRHRVLKEFLVKALEVEPDLAGKVACDMEHHIDRRVFDKLEAFTQSLDTSGKNTDKGNT